MTPAREHLRRSAPAERRSVPLLRTAVGRHLVEAGLERDRVDEIRLAVSEAVTNAVLHAGAATIVVEVEVTRSEVRAVVSDDGRGIAPRTDSPGAGLGLPIMAGLALRLEVGPVRGGRGTEVRMAFAR